MARDIYPGASSPLLSLLTTCGPDVFFYARDNGASGLELWKSDGTAAGTLQVKEIHPGTSNASITEIVAVEDRIYFTANDGVHGEELWTSDGSPEGTVVAFDGVPGSSGSTPAELVFTGNRLFFSAYTPATGSELFSMAEGRDLQISVESGPATIDPQGVIDFGAIVMGSSSPAVSLRFMNRGGRPFALEAIFPGGEDVAAFDVQAGSLPEELEPGEAMNVRVVFTPLGAGNATAHLTVTCGDFDAPERSVVLRGLGTRAPMFTGYSTLATSLPVVIREADVLDEASDPDQDVLGVANVSPSTPNHGTVMRGGGMIVYRPAPGFSGTDSFPVVIRDVHGATVDGLVSVIVPDGELENLQPDPLRLESISDGGRELVFRGIPGFTYTVQQSHSLTGWEDVAVVLADPNGVIRWTLPPVAAEAVFYRLVIP